MHSYSSQSFHEPSRPFIFFALFLLTPFASASAIEYGFTSATLNSSAFVSLAGGDSDYCFEDDVGLTPASGDSVGDACGVAHGAAASGSLSALEGSGFSFSGSTSLWTDVSEQPVGSSAQIRAETRLVQQISLADSTQLKVSLDWNDVAMLAEDSQASALVAISITRQFGPRVNEYEIQAFDRFNTADTTAASGSISYLLDLGQGDYEIRVNIISTAATSSGLDQVISSNATVGVSVVPVPAAVWLFASALGLLGVSRRSLSKSATARPRLAV